MNILTFESFKLLLEAQEDPSKPIQTPAPEPPDDEPTTEEPLAEPASTETPPVTSEPSIPDSSFSPSAPSTPDAGTQPDPFAQQTLPEDPNAVPVETPETSIKFTILDNTKKWHTKYTDSGGIKRFKEYEISTTELDKWITDNGLDSKKSEIYDAMAGKSPIDKETLSKLQSDLSSKKIGKDLGDVDVSFDDKLVPSTNQLDLVFVTRK
jgi:hypothetical protein